MRALVIGATGFVGGKLVERLASEHVEVHALVRAQSRDKLATRADVHVHVGGIEDPNVIADAARGCDVVFHCASESSPHASERALAWINVAGTENVVTALRAAAVPRLVMLSCADVTLIDADRLNWKEDANLMQRPLDACLRSKLLAEELARQSSHAGLHVVAVRPAWLWGPGEPHNLPMLCGEARSGGIRLFGSGNNLFATTHIDNLIEALWLAAKRGQGGSAYHVADAETVTAGEFFERLCAALGTRPPRRGNRPFAYVAAQLRARMGQEGPLPVDVVRRARGSLLDCTHAIGQLGYEPPVDMADGMEALAQWARERGGIDALMATARKPQSDESIQAHERAADTYDGDEDAT
jgi:nucleoside-diphosphate-sugar epimerase